MRELNEATGFVGTIKKIGPVLAMDPGASNCSMRLVTVEVSSCILLPKHVIIHAQTFSRMFTF
jgi:hypothetical protein